MTSRRSVAADGDEVRQDAAAGEEEHLSEELFLLLCEDALTERERAEASRHLGDCLRCLQRSVDLLGKTITTTFPLPAELLDDPSGEAAAERAFQVRLHLAPFARVGVNIGPTAYPSLRQALVDRLRGTLCPNEVTQQQRLRFLIAVADEAERILQAAVEREPNDTARGLSGEQPTTAGGELDSAQHATGLSASVPRRLVLDRLAPREDTLSIIFRLHFFAAVPFDDIAQLLGQPEESLVSDYRYACMVVGVPAVPPPST